MEADLDNRTDAGQRFSMTFMDGGSQLATDLREGALSYKDVAVFMAVTLKLDYRTGMAAIKAKDLAEFIGMNPSLCRACLGRLQQRMLLARGTTKDGGIRYIPNPYVTCCGSVSRRPFLWKLFKQAIETGSVALPDGGA